MTKRLLMIIVCAFTMLCAGAQTYISDLAVTVAESRLNASDENALKNLGYTRLDSKIDVGRVYLMYKTTTDPTKAISDVIIVRGSIGWNNSELTIDGKKYKRAAYNNEEYKGNINHAEPVPNSAKMLFYSCDDEMNKITELNVSYSSRIEGYECTPGYNGTSFYVDCCCTGLDNYLHTKKKAIHTMEDGICIDKNCKYCDPIEPGADGWYEVNKLSEYIRIIRTNFVQTSPSGVYGVKIRLNCDLDYGDFKRNSDGTFTVIKNSISIFGAYCNTFLNSVIDGQGHTIKGAVEKFFGSMFNTEVKNLRITESCIDHDITGNSSSFFGSVRDNSKVSNICIDNCYLSKVYSILTSYSRESEFSNIAICHNVIKEPSFRGYAHLASESNSKYSNCLLFDNEVESEYDRLAAIGTKVDPDDVWLYGNFATLSNIHQVKDTHKNGQSYNEYMALMQQYYNGDFKKLLNGTVDENGVWTASKKGSWVQTVGRDAHPVLSFMGTASCCNSDSYMSGDVNADRKVDISDVAALVDSLKSGNTQTTATDINLDKSVNIKDVEGLVKIVTGESKQMAYVKRTGTVSVYVDSIYKLPVSVTPSSTANLLAWSSSDKTIATVDKKGNVKGVSEGKATITATLSNTGVEVSSYDVNVYPLYVDLELPSGTIWASCDIGASDSEATGLLFRWADTKGCTVEEYKEEKWPKRVWFDSQNYHPYTKYCGCGEKGCPNDGKYVLDLEDDAAYVNLGPDWRIPTAAELKEIYGKSRIVYDEYGMPHWNYTSKTTGKFYTMVGRHGYMTNELDTLYKKSGSWGWVQSVSSSYRPDRALFLGIRPVRRQKKFTSAKLTYSRDFIIYIDENYEKREITVQPSTVTDVATEWSSSDPSIVEVEKLTGKIKSKSKEGVAYIRMAALGMDKVHTDSVKVIVIEKKTTAPQYVDLGLPSGTLWATFNVGGNSPEDPGLYFAWGETKGYDWEHRIRSTKDYDFTKYDYSGEKIYLNLEDDAAYVNWGEEWRMPSSEEQEELVENCTWTWTTVNNVGGYIGVSKINSNSIFFPLYNGRYGLNFYWSNTRTTYAESGDCLLFSNYNPQVFEFDRWTRHPVRAVRR